MRRRRVGAVVACVAAVLLVQVGEVPVQAQLPAAKSVPGTSGLNDVWCRADGSCLAVGTTPEGTGVVAVVHADGAVGAVRPVPGSRSLYSIACSSAGCVAVGELLAGGPALVTVSNDGTPSSSRPVSGADDLWRVACPTTTTCLATGSVVERVTSYPYFVTWAVYVVITNGQPAPAQRFPTEADRILTGISCPTATTCLAVNGRVAVLTNAGGTWTARLSPSMPGTAGYITDDLSCGSPSQCFGTAAVFLPVRSGGKRGVPGTGAVTADGLLGPVQAVTSQGGNSRGISCPVGTGRCTVVGELHEGAAFAADTSRGNPVAISYWTNALGFSGVSCVTGQSCGLVGGNGTNGVFAWKGPPVP